MLVKLDRVREIVKKECAKIGCYNFKTILLSALDKLEAEAFARPIKEFNRISAEIAEGKQKQKAPMWLHTYKASEFGCHGRFSGELVQVITYTAPIPSLLEMEHIKTEAFND